MVSGGFDEVHWNSIKSRNPGFTERNAAERAWEIGGRGSQKLKRFRGGIVFKAHRLVYHSTLGWRVMKKKRRGSQVRVDRNLGSVNLKGRGSQPHG